MWTFLYSLFFQSDDDLFGLVEDDMDEIKTSLVTLDSLFFEPLTRDTMNEIDVVCNDIAEKIISIQQTTLRIKNQPHKDENDRIVKNSKLLEISLQLQKISDSYLTKQADYLCKTSRF
jgi:hypothetical protein